jgi:hypothetical protein
VFGFSSKHSKIKVDFFEAGRDKPFATSMVPIGQLPDTFELATTFDIGEQKWSVLAAVPTRKSDFEKSGKLKLILSALQMVDPKDILFSLPTINDRLFPIRKGDSLDGMLVIHEDDWRQIEFVSEKFAAQVESEIQSIRTIYETKRRGVGFTGLHVRKLIENPIEKGAIPYDALKKLFTVSKEFSGFGVGGFGNGDIGIGENGFAFETEDGLQFYGILDENRNVEFLCLALAEGFNEKCKGFMAAFHLLGVNWCRGEVARVQM